MSSLVALIALSGQASAAEIHVPADYPTIAAAVLAARPVDTVVLDTDIQEDLILNNETVTIEGAVQQNTLSGSIVITGNSNVTFSNLTLAGGEPETSYLEITLGRLCQSLSAGLSVIDSRVTFDDATLLCFSPAVIAIDSTIDVSGSAFRFNISPDTEGAGAIQAVDSDLTVEGSEFELNTGYPGGAISVTEQSNPGESTVHIQTSSFLNNSSSGGPGGAIYSRVGHLKLWANQFNNNYNLVYFTPGISLEDAAALGINVSGILVGLGEGAGIYVDDGSGQSTDCGPGSAVGGQWDSCTDIWNNTFCGNIADAGGGVYVNNVEDAALYNNRFAENWSAHYGGGVYVEADDVLDYPVRVVNNTFLNQNAGKLPPPNDGIIVAYGAGGAAAFINTVADFRNNVVAFTQSGGGLLGVASDLGVSLEGGASPDFTIGDLLRIDYNDFYGNCDIAGCQPEDGVDFTGDLSAISLPSTNIALDPFPAYFVGGEFNCLPDAFYPTWDSPVVWSGDVANEPNRFDPNCVANPGPNCVLTSDMGAYGGPRADVLDRDGDGYANIYDCNDEPGGGSVHPGASEICDQYDNDCDGEIDEGWETTWYPDADADGFGDISQIQPIIDCTQPANHVLNRTDCNDSNDEVNPSAGEICNGLDDDCDGAADGGLDFVPLYVDRDGDGYGSGAQENGCLAQDENQGPGAYYIINEDGSLTLKVGGYVENNDDCNDFEPTTNPDGIDVCDGVDNDCDTVIDNGTDGTEYRRDEDGDGFGWVEDDRNPDNTPEDPKVIFACSPPGAGWVETPVNVNDLDCDDTDAGVSPAAEEICDGIDNDCKDGSDKNAAIATLYQDLDQDGFGNPYSATTDCFAVDNPEYVAKGGDCDDNDPNVGECVECGCRSTPTPGSAGAIGMVMSLAVLGLRRRRV